jgi:predicted nucleic acid-binding protein
MVKALFDTNILIDYLNASQLAKDELFLYQEKAISVITWMEVMVGTDTHNIRNTEVFLNNFFLIELDDAIAKQAVELRKRYKVKLPDAIVWASAQVNAMLLVTRDSKDFQKHEPGIRIPYKIC